MLTDLWHRAFDAQPQPPRLLVLITAVLALVVVLPHRPWRLGRNVITIAHEGGHALVSLLSGRRLESIRLHSDTSGLTVSRGRATGPGMVATLVAGYVTPSLLGLAGAALLASGRIRIMLWLTLVLLLAVLVMTRNGYGILSVLATGAVVFLVSCTGRRRYRRPSRTSACGSCCSAACGRYSRCSGSAGAAKRAPRTRISWRP